MTAVRLAVDLRTLDANFGIVRSLLSASNTKHLLTGSITTASEPRFYLTSVFAWRYFLSLQESSIEVRDIVITNVITNARDLFVAARE